MNGGRSPATDSPMKQPFSDLFETLKSGGPDSRILDDLARVAGGAVNIVSGFQQQIRDEIQTRFDDMAARMDLVPRDDLARAEARIEKLEREVAALMKNAAPSKKTATKKKPAVKKPATKKPAAKKK